MKIRFTVTLFIIFICIFYYTDLSAIANIPGKEKTTDNIDTNLENGCIRTCLNDYTKIAKCDINEMISDSISELDKEN